MTYHLDRRNGKGLAFGILLVVLALATAVSYAISHSGLRRHGGPQRQDDAPSRIAYKIVRHEIFTGSGGQSPVLMATKIRYQKSNGDWKEVTRYFSKDGQLTSRHAVFGIGGRGVLGVNEETQSLDYISPMALSASGVGLGVAAKERETALRADPHFVREETVLDRSAAVLRFSEGDPRSGYYVEAYYAPSLDGVTPIKELFVNAAGTTVVEPVLVKLAEPTPGEFGQVPNWPLAFGLYERKIQLAENAGREDIAAAMRRRIEGEVGK